VNEQDFAAVSKPRIGGPRCGDPMPILQSFMPAKSEKHQSIAQVAAKSPCRGAARRCAAAFGRDYARG
jgi:hypothetical protein